MWEKEPFERTLSDRPSRGFREKFPPFARTVSLLFLLTLSVWFFPSRYLFTSLAPNAHIVTVSGLVRRAPEGTPLPHAVVYSDRELAVTDESGVFELKAREGTKLRFEAEGFEPTSVTVKRKEPIVVLLFPEKPAPGAPKTSAESSSDAAGGGAPGTSR